jgi:uncharacterized protein (TIRG00374 family)
MSTRSKYLIFAIGLALFCYLVYSYGIANIVHNLQQTGWWFLPIVLVWAVVYALNAMAWFVILRDHHSEIRFGTIFRVSLTAFALNYVTPFLNLGGEPYRAAALGGLVDKHRAISSVILYNMVRWVAHFGFWLSAVAAAFVTISVSPVFALALGAVSAALLLCIWFFITRHKYGIFESLIAWMSGRGLLHSFVQRLEPHGAALHTIDTQIRQLYTQQRGTFYLSITFEYVSRVIASYEFYFILKALGYAPTFLEALYINAATSFILNALFFVPFELGTREGGLLLVMQTLAYAQGIGIFIGLVNRLRELVWILIGMAVMLRTKTPEPRHSLIELIENGQNV